MVMASSAAAARTESAGSSARYQSAACVSTTNRVSNVFPRKVAPHLPPRCGYVAFGNRDAQILPEPPKRFARLVRRRAGLQELGKVQHLMLLFRRQHADLLQDGLFDRHSGSPPLLLNLARADLKPTGERTGDHERAPVHPGSVLVPGGHPAVCPAQPEPR